MRISELLRARILDHLTFLYGAGQAGVVWQRLEAILGDFYRRFDRDGFGLPAAGDQLSERDAILITYGDQFQEPGRPPLETLYQVLAGSVGDVVSGVHILPFFPYSSDDGFSIIDYARVNPEFGTWDDVERVGQDYRLMFDAVINHISRHSEWFRRFLAGEPAYGNWFIAFEPDASTDWIPLVVRPRALPLLTLVETADGDKLVWTTFSDDQIDLNYAEPSVLLAVIEVLLLYVEKGAQFIRLDAIAYLWKTPGTMCLHLEETHRVVKLLRCVLDAIAPETILITETNVPHEENVSYFGALLDKGGSLSGEGALSEKGLLFEKERTDEAQMVYQFSLAPLAIHSLLSGSAEVLSRWASGLETPAPQATFFNFTASHDGIGVMPARGLLSEGQIQALVDATLAHGGRASYKTNADGSQSVYELNISYFDALSDPAGGEPQSLQVARFVASQAIMLAMAGVPGIYVHSLLGSRSWQEGVASTGRNRSINRQKLDRHTLERELADPESVRHQVFDAYSRLLRARAAEPAFHPQGAQQVLSLDERVFALLRTAPDGSSRVLCLHNVSGQARRVRVPLPVYGLAPGAWRDLITGQVRTVEGEAADLVLPAYAVRWLQVRGSA